MAYLLTVSLCTLQVTSYDLQPRSTHILAMLDKCFMIPDTQQEYMHNNYSGRIFLCNFNVQLKLSPLGKNKRCKNLIIPKLVTQTQSNHNDTPLRCNTGWLLSRL